jgi:hypothetical protein
VNLGDGLEEIGALAFKQCTSLNAIVIPPAVKAIKFGAFASCTQLTIVRLEEGLEVIRLEAFFHCISLNDITIPSTVKSINCRAFA